MGCVYRIFFPVNLRSILNIAKSALFSYYLYYDINITFFFQHILFFCIAFLLKDTSVFNHHTFNSHIVVIFHKSRAVDIKSASTKKKKKKEKKKKNISDCSLRKSKKFLIKMIFIYLLIFILLFCLRRIFKKISNSISFGENNCIPLPFI